MIEIVLRSLINMTDQSVIFIKYDSKFS
jgi:hypothetical protein